VVNKIKERTIKEIEANELKINEVLGIDFNSMVVDNFNFPNGTCCFITDTLLYVNIFHPPTLTHYHFVYNHSNKNVSQITQVKLRKINDKNFP